MHIPWWGWLISGFVAFVVVGVIIVGIGMKVIESIMRGGN